ncbi:MAG: nicotinamide riboside transporter PnuC [Bacteroidota bacterium]|nr:nicotinamide riboside transporter PnuC [Bacteroidota bacterium]
MNWQEFFKIDSIVFTIFNYPVSYIELIGTLAGIIAVWLAAKSNLLTWPIGLINIILFFFIYFQIHLYSDMFLQVYYFIISIYGWVYWKQKSLNKGAIYQLNLSQRIKFGIVILILSAILGYFISHIHQVFPKLFTSPASFPYVDTFVAVSSIVANTLLARRVIDNWLLWIIVNVTCIYIYIQRGVYIIAFEFLIFLGIAVYALFYWKKLINSQNNPHQFQQI